MKRGAIVDHLAWLFLPGRFLDGRDRRRTLRVRGWETLCLVENVEELARINRATGDIFLGGKGNAFLEALLGPQSVFLLDHEAHRATRKLLGQALNSRTVDAHRGLIDEILADEFARQGQRGHSSLCSFSRRVTMRLLCKLVLDVDDAQIVGRLFDRFEATTGFLANIVSYHKPFWRRRGLVSVGRYVEHIVGRIDRELYPLIAQAKLNSAGDTAVSLHLLVKQQAAHGYDDAYIRDNLVALLAAGYDTTGSALSWLLYWAGRERRTFERTASAHRSGNEQALPAFVAEVLRYCPPLEILPRRIAAGRSDEACALSASVRSTVGDGATDPMVCPCAHRVQHDPTIFTSPERFDPERFIGKREFPSSAYLPFGAGVRMCLGARYGRLILERTAATLIDQGLTVELQSTRFQPIRRNVSLWPGVFLRGELIPLSTEVRPDA